jgi:glucose-6-phosphate 1-dehydrogenase
MFDLADADSQAADEPNKLVIDLGEPGGITANFLAKVPGARMVLGSARMSFHYEDSFCIANQLEAYERLIHDAMVGDHTLFTRSDGIERLWEVAAPVLGDPPSVQPYAPGTWGPVAVHDFIAPHRWQLPEPG